MKKIFVFILSGFLLFSFTQCSKTGPQGPEGPAGPRGPVGDSGPEGDPGAANVRSSGWTILPAASWSYNITSYNSDYIGQSGDLENYSSRSLGTLTEDERAGVVLVYFSENGNTRNLLPFQKQITASSKSGTVELRFAYASGQVYIIAALKSGTWDKDYIKNTFLPRCEWNLVTIPWGTLGKTPTPEVDFNNFGEVQTHYNLKE